MTKWLITGFGLGWMIWSGARGYHYEQVGRDLMSIYYYALAGLWPIAIYRVWERD